MHTKHTLHFENYRKFYEWKFEEWFEENLILTNCTQRPSSQSLGLYVMSLEPESLQFLMIVRTECMTLKNPVQFLEMAPMEGDNRLSFQHTLVTVQPSARWQGPQEPAKPLHRACLLENLDRRHHRLEDDRQGGHTVSRQNSSRSPLILVYLVYFSIVTIISSRIYSIPRKGSFFFR